MSTRPTPWPSIGIPVVVATLVNSSAVMHAQLAEYFTPFNTALLAVIDPATDAGGRLLTTY